MMRFLLRLPLPLFMVCLLYATGCCAAGYDACLKEEKRLRLAEAEACNGLNYIVNPSACFNIRKELAPYIRGKCHEVAAREGVNEPKVEPARAVETPVAPQVSPVAAGAPVAPGAADKAIEELRKEVATLKEEIELLKKEIARLKGEQK